MASYRCPTCGPDVDCADDTDPWTDYDGPDDSPPTPDRNLPAAVSDDPWAQPGEPADEPF